MKTLYVAFDGTFFNSVDKCQKYENKILNKNVTLYSHKGEKIPFNRKNLLLRTRFLEIPNEFSLEIFREYVISNKLYDYIHCLDDFTEAGFYLLKFFNE